MTRNQGSQEAAYYLSLLAYFDNVRAKIDALPEGGGAPRPLVMNVIVWGARYVDSLLTYSFPSLMAAGNIPQLARGRRVIIDIFTTQGDRDAITASPAGKAVMACATLRFTIIADNLLSGAAQKSVFNYDRWLIAGAQQCSALHARRIGADVTFISCSAVYSMDCFSVAAGFIDEGYRAVVTCPPRTEEPAMLSHLKHYAEISSGAITIDAPSLTRFAIDNLHSHSRACFIAAQPKLAYQSAVALFFRTRSGFAIRSFQLSPILISHRLLDHGFSFDYLSVDARFIAELVRGKSPGALLKVISNPAEEMVVADIDTASGPAMKAYDGVPVTIDASATFALATVLRETDLAFYEWALRQRVEYTTSGDPGSLPERGLDEDETIESLIGLIRQQSQSVRKTLRLYRSSPRSHSA